MIPTLSFGDITVPSTEKTWYTQTHIAVKNSIAISVIQPEHNCNAQIRLQEFRTKSFTELKNFFNQNRSADQLIDTSKHLNGLRLSSN